MRLIAAWAFWLLAQPALAGLPLVGDRAWIRLEAPNLRDDGYAVGLVQSIDGDHALIAISQLVEGPGRTLYGSCNPGAEGLQAPYSAQTVAASPAGQVVERVPLTLISDWRSGKHRFLEREQLATIFFKWRGDSLGLPAARAEMAADKARALDLPRAAAAFEVVAADIRWRGAAGFPLPVVQQLPALPALPAALDAVSFAVATHSEDGQLPAVDADDLLSLATAVFAERARAVLSDWQNERADQTEPQQDGAALAAAIERHAELLAYPGTSR